jgi:hypothetical protein
MKFIYERQIKLKGCSALYRPLLYQDEAIFEQCIQRQGVCHIVALPFTLKSI